MDKNSTTKSPLAKLIQERFEAADNWLEPKRKIWTEHENLMHNQLSDQISQITKAQVFDPVLSTLSLYRSFRVMAQLATGKVKAISRNDEGAAKLMNLALDKYVLPNANAQFAFLTKCRMVDMYSDVYGAFPVLVDLDVRRNGYIGPDMWMIAVRDFFPQVGAVSLPDSDFAVVRSWQPISYFEFLAEKNKGNKNFKNLQVIIDRLKEKPGDKDSKDSRFMSSREQNAYPSSKAAKGKGFYSVLSMYENDRWVDCVPSADFAEFRDMKNPHDNDELPIIMKNSIPLLDDFMGMGGYERGKTMQLANNSLWNLYLDACKISIFPPVMFNKEAIAEKASIKWSAAAKWMMKGNPAAAAQVLNLTPQGINTFNNTQQNIKASLLNMFGTTDTTVTSKTDPGFGRTPDALKMQQARENTGDNVDRYYMEEFLTSVYRKFVNITAKKGESIQVRMFQAEIQELAKQYPDIKDAWDEKTGKLTIDKKTTGSIIYDYEIVPGSTYAVDQQNQQQSLTELFKVVTDGLAIDPQNGKVTSPLIVALENENKEIKIGEMLTRIISNSGIQDWDKIIVDMTKSNNHEAVLADTSAKFTAALQALMGGQVPAAPNGATGLPEGAIAPPPGPAAGQPAIIPGAQPLPPPPMGGVVSG